MRIPNQRHLAQDLRVHALLRDFRLEDVWELPGVEGDLDDFDRAVQMSLATDPAGSARGLAGALWKARELLGRWLRLGDVTEAVDEPGGTVPGTGERSLRGRLPADLRGTVEGLSYAHLPFVPLYRTATEYAAEISNATVHGVMHLSWVPRGDGTYQGRMAVYVKPRGLLGEAYMAFIKPFRYLVVYPAMERQVGRQWEAMARPR